MISRYDFPRTGTRMELPAGVPADTVPRLHVLSNEASPRPFCIVLARPPLHTTPLYKLRAGAAPWVLEEAPGNGLPKEVSLPLIIATLNAGGVVVVSSPTLENPLLLSWLFGGWE